MCGIIGFIIKEEKRDLVEKVMNRDNREKEAEFVLRTMMNQIIHRGPDGSGIYVDSHITLGHRRLSIIDIEGGRQPMENEDGRLICIFNGEIYNYAKLKELLVEKGHVFATKSDTEVLLHGYEEWGEALSEKLRGMFAFAIWDRQEKKLFCARDYFGIKPFYYYHRDDVFLFGSEIKCFLPHPDFKKELNKEQLELYLSFQYSPGENTFFKNVYKLAPGHSLSLEEGRLEIKWYDSIPKAIRCSLGGVAKLFPPMSGINFLVRHSKPLKERYIGNTCLFSERQKRRLLKDYSGNVLPMDLIKEKIRFTEEIDDVTRMQLTDIYMWLTGDILLKADKMSMANSLELRVPFLDKEVFSVAGKIPTNYRVNAKQTKILLREAAKSEVGNITSERRKKGFPVPVREWLRQEPYRNDVKKYFASDAAKEFFYTEYLMKMLEEHKTGKHDWWREIWCIYMFLI